ncbi:MAG TPA: hypothetical protein VF701_09665 [Thermoanaerobaculia bacterium]
MGSRSTARRSHARLDRLFDRALATGAAGDSEAWLEEAPPAEAIAFLVGNFDAQITRGGLQFWIHNGFATLDEPLLRALRPVRGAEVRDVRALIRRTEVIAAQARALLKQDESPESDAALDGLAERLAVMDEKYYAIRKEFLSAVEELLAKRTADDAVAVSVAPKLRVAKRAAHGRTSKTESRGKKRGR